MRVLLVQPSMNVYDGSALVIVKLAEYMASQRIDHALLTTNILPEIEKDLCSTPIFKTPYERSNSWQLDMLKDLWLLNSAVRQRAKNYDVINIHNIPAEFSIFPVSRPVVWMCHERPDIYLSSMVRQNSISSVVAQKAFYAADKHIVKRYVKQAVVPDRYNADRFRDLYAFDPHVIPYGIDYDFFSTEPDDFFKKKSDDFIVLHVGNLSVFKNQKESMRCVKLLKKDIPGIRLVIAGYGEGAYINELKSEIHAEGLEQNVLLTGQVNRDRLRVFYHRADVLLHPIRRQGGWMTPFEALATGTPVIVSKEMTASDIIEKEGIGIVTDDYVAALTDIYDNLSQYREVAVSGRLFVRNRLRWDNFSAEMVKVFKAAV